MWVSCTLIVVVIILVLGAVHPMYVFTYNSICLYIYIYRCSARVVRGRREDPPSHGRKPVCFCWKFYLWDFFSFAIVRIKRTFQYFSLIVFSNREIKFFKDVYCLKE